MKAVITVTGRDSVGIIANVSRVCADQGANILDITQTVVSEYFNMVLIADISSEQCSFSKLSDALSELGQELGLQIRVQRSEIFEAMYKV